MNEGNAMERHVNGWALGRFKDGPDLFAALAIMDERARTGSPFFFAGLPAAMCGPDDDVLLPPESAQVDWEAELAVVIGATGRRVPRERALDYVAGYTARPGRVTTKGPEHEHQSRSPRHWARPRGGSRRGRVRLYPARRQLDDQ